jgi:hypothetical protein
MFKKAGVLDGYIRELEAKKQELEALRKEQAAALKETTEELAGVVAALFKLKD